MNESELRSAMERFIRAAHASSNASMNLGISSQIETQKELFSARRALDTALDEASENILMKG